MLLRTVARTPDTSESQPLLGEEGVNGGRASLSKQMRGLSIAMALLLCIIGTLTFGASLWQLLKKK
jgi:hypothetical protein